MYSVQLKHLGWQKKDQITSPKVKPLSLAYLTALSDDSTNSPHLHQQQ